MKKIISLFLISLMLITSTVYLASCSIGNESSVSSNNSSSYSGSKTLTISEREEIAENAVLNSVLDMLESNKSVSKKYDISATKYKTGNITHSGDTFTVYLTLAFYDNYGKYQASAEISPKVEVDETGEVGSCTGTFVYDKDIK